MRKIRILAILLIILGITACQAATPIPAQDANVPAEQAQAYPAESQPQEPVAQAEMAYPAKETASESAASPAVIEIKDALDRTVVFEQTPQRCVLVGRGVFMVADAVYTFPEASKNLIAIAAMTQNAADFISMIDPEFDAKESIDRSASAEQIAALQPDCVILKTSNAAKMGTSLEALEIPLVYVDFETPEQFSRDLKTLGALFGNPARAEELISYYIDNMKAVTEKVDILPTDQRPDVLLVYYDVKDGAVAFNVPPKSWMQTLLIQMAGGRPVWEDIPLEDSWTKVSMEQIAAWNPDTILVTAYAVDVPEAMDALLADPQWQALEAVKNGKIYGFASDVYTYDQPDTRWALGLKWAAATLHPELFPDFNLQESAAEFYKTVYNMDDASFQKNILPILYDGTAE